MTLARTGARRARAAARASPSATSRPGEPAETPPVRAGAPEADLVPVDPERSHPTSPRWVRTSTSDPVGGGVRGFPGGPRGGGVDGRLRRGGARHRGPRRPGRRVRVRHRGRGDARPVRGGRPRHEATLDATTSASSPRATSRSRGRVSSSDTSSRVGATDCSASTSTRARRRRNRRTGGRAPRTTDRFAEVADAVADLFDP